MSIPISQITFSDEDILAFATEELVLSQIPSILQYHEEYYVYSEIVPLVSGKSRYSLPGRAIGMKLRDLAYVDTQGQLVEMSKVNPDDASYFQSDSNSNTTPIHYYLKNNSIVIVPEVSQNVQGSLKFTYYLRPNSLVPDEQAAVSTGFSKNITVNNTTLVAGDKLVIDSVEYEADVDFVIGANSSITATNLGNALASDYANVVTGDIVTITYFDRGTSITSTNTAALSVQQTITIVATVPDTFASGQMVDILQMDGGHSTLNFDVVLANGSVSTTGLTFKESDIPEEFVVGDYICQRYECIVPQIPTDLHVLLGERTGARVLESLGDVQGLETANKKIMDLESRQSVIIDSRVEGSPTKVFNRHSLLRYGKSRFGRGSI
jgi:hypothetical protein